MNHLQTIAEGIGPSEEHIRVLEAYRREHDIPISLPYSTAAFNRAVEWWNAAPAAAQDAAKGRPFAELRNTGLLWLINTSVLHPRGFALSIVPDADGNAIGWRLEGDGSEPWTFLVDDPELDARFAAVNQLLAPRNDRSTPREGNPHG